MAEKAVEILIIAATTAERLLSGLSVSILQSRCMLLLVVKTNVGKYPSPSFMMAAPALLRFDLLKGTERESRMMRLFR